MAGVKRGSARRGPRGISPIGIGPILNGGSSTALGDCESTGVYAWGGKVVVRRRVLRESQVPQESVV